MLEMNQRLEQRQLLVAGFATLATTSMSGRLIDGFARHCRIRNPTRR